MRVSAGFYTGTGIPSGSALNGDYTPGCRPIMDGSGVKVGFLLRDGY